MPYRHCKTAVGAAVLALALTAGPAAFANDYVPAESSADCDSVAAQFTGFPETKPVLINYTVGVNGATATSGSFSSPGRRFVREIAFPAASSDSTVTLHLTWEHSGSHVADQSFSVKGCPAPAPPAPPVAVVPPTPAPPVSDTPAAQRVGPPMRPVAHTSKKLKARKCRIGYHRSHGRKNRCIPNRSRTIDFAKTVKRFAG